MIVKCPLPVKSGFNDAEAYVESLLSFITSSKLFQNLCGGVHILDFLTKEPDLYSTVLQKNGEFGSYYMTSLPSSTFS